MDRPKVIVIVGPTASGKSALAVQLARQFSGEVVSADSRQVYRGLDIGTGKITKREMRGVPHHFIDIAAPKTQFTAHDFQTAAQDAIADIVSRGKVPIICGGTGFYIDALLGRISLSSVPIDEKLRLRLRKKSAAQLFSILNKRDPRRAKSIAPKNRHRLMRAIEIASAPSSERTPSRKRKRYDALWIGLSPAPATLRKAIRIRLSERLKRGMLAEARRLHARGLSFRRMEELGLEYRFLAQFLQKKITHADMLEQLRFAIWHYAKRQRTYWRRNDSIQWFTPGPASTRAISARVRAFL